MTGKVAFVFTLCIDVKHISTSKEDAMQYYVATFSLYGGGGISSLSESASESVLS